MLATERVNHKRQVELDLARGLAVFFMLNAHVLLYLSDSQVRTFFWVASAFSGRSSRCPCFHVHHGHRSSLLR